MATRGSERRPLRPQVGAPSIDGLVGKRGKQPSLQNGLSDTVDKETPETLKAVREELENFAGKGIEHGCQMAVLHKRKR
jgi:hypothetical protein